jgi:hypothetical protein
MPARRWSIPYGARPRLPTLRPVRRPFGPRPGFLRCCLRQHLSATLGQSAAMPLPVVRVSLWGGTLARYRVGSRRLRADACGRRILPALSGVLQDKSKADGFMF